MKLYIECVGSIIRHKVVIGPKQNGVFIPIVPDDQNGAVCKGSFHRTEFGTAVVFDSPTSSKHSAIVVGTLRFIASIAASIPWSFGSAT